MIYYNMSLILIINIIQMYTPKSTSMSSHTFHAQRDTSPLSRNHSNNKTKSFSNEEVSKLIRATIEPKLNYLKREIDEKQKIIAILNEKLDQNDQRIVRMQNYIQNLLRKQKQMGFFQTQQSGNIVSTVNQILNDKIKQYWQTISAQLKLINQRTQQKFSDYDRKAQIKIQNQIQTLKEFTHKYIESSRTKSNNYWLKIKEALNRVNSKIAKVDESIANINHKFQNQKVKQEGDRQIVAQLQNSKKTVKKLIQLKKSINNIYENYHNVLELQKGFKKKVQQFDTNNQDSFKFGFDQQSMKSPNIKKQESKYEKIAKRLNSDDHDQFVALDYSKDDPNLFTLDQKVSPISNYKQVYKYNNLLSVPSKQIKQLSSPSKSPLKNRESPSQQHSEIFSCLNSTNNPLATMNSRNQSLINLSLQNRRQMAESVRQRLQELIQLKCLTRPLDVYVDQINYLKNREGNYIFDTKGNMFKIQKQELSKLQREGVLRIFDPNQKVRSGSKSRLKNV